MVFLHMSPRNKIILFLVGLVMIVASGRHGMPSSRVILSAAKSQNSFRLSTALYSRSNGKFRKAVSTELGEAVTKITRTVATEVRYCYFDKRMPCPCEGHCRIDDRSCTANRDYFDSVYQRKGDLTVYQSGEKFELKANDAEGNSSDSESGNDNNTLQ
jgi:hypothetical protein